MSEGPDGQQQQQVPTDGGVKPWYDGVADAETIGYLQNRGLHDKPVNEVALATIKAHREAQTYLGVPAERLIRLPENLTDPDAMKPVYARLGVPEKPEGYDFSPLKGEDGQPLVSEAEATWLRGVAYKLNIPAAQATQFAQELLAHNAEIDAGEAAETTAKLAEEHKVLDASWGQNKEANTFLARKGAEKLGFDAETVNALEKVVGYSKIMEGLRRVGELAGEARFVGNGSPSFNDGIMTREQAAERKATLMKDTAWVTRYNSGDAAAAKEMLALNTIIVGDDTEASRR